jgi:cysteine-rich secretory family protein
VAGDFHKGRRAAPILFVCALLGSAAASSDAWAASYSSIRMATAPERLVAAHNVERAMARVPPLSWDASLAAQAWSYARLLAATGTFRHSDRRSRGGTGENLWMGSRGAYSIEQMVSGWTSERRMFVPGTFPFVSRTRSWEDVGHYTQMIWPTTTRVGCAVASARGNDVLVCRYGPAGNVDGRPVPGWSARLSSR